MRKFLKIVLLLILLFQSCYTAPELPPHMQKWPEPVNIINATEGGLLFLYFEITGNNTATPHRLWWAWDNDPFSYNVKLEITQPIQTINGIFIINDWMVIKLSKFKPGVHVLKILLHNENTDFNLKSSYVINVEKKQEETFEELTVIGVRTYYNWVDMITLEEF